MNESKEILTMRAFAWERAKAELQCFLHTYWGAFSKDDIVKVSSSYDLTKKKITEFIKDFEDNCR